MDVAALLTLIIQVAGGALGGNLVGALTKGVRFDAVSNAIAGMVGGGVAGQIFGHVVQRHAPSTGGSTLDVAAGLDHAVAGGIGGAVLLAMIAIVRKHCRR